MKCPVCNNETLIDNAYEWDICEECFWEYDPLQVSNPDYRGGANHHSLNEYKKIYNKLKKENPDFSCKNPNDRDLIIKLDRDKNTL